MKKEEGTLKLNRRSFLKWSSVLGGTIALGGEGVLGLKKADAATAGSANAEGKWIPVSCWADCGRKGFNKVYVVAGVLTRAATDNTIPAPP